jgi:uncharacterized protein YuzE
MAENENFIFFDDLELNSNFNVDLDSQNNVFLGDVNVTLPPSSLKSKEELILSTISKKIDKNITSATFDNDILIAGGELGKIYGIDINSNSSKVLFETDQSPVYNILNLENNVNLASIGNKVYLMLSGDLNFDQEEEIEESSEDIVGEEENPNENKTVVVTYPNGGEDIVFNERNNILWSSTRGINDAVKIELLKSEEIIQTITESTLNSGNYTWLPNDLDSGNDYKIRITWLSAGDPDPNDVDESDANFNIVRVIPNEEDI